MKRMKCCVLFCFVFCYAVNDKINCLKIRHICNEHAGNAGPRTKCCLDYVSKCLEDKTCKPLQAIKDVEKFLANTEVSETSGIHTGSFMALVHKPPTSGHRGLSMSVSDSEGATNEDVPGRRVRAQLPREVNLGPNNTVALWTIQLPDQDVWKGLENLYNNRLIGLTVRGMEVSGLKEPVKITISITTNISENLKPQCVYLNTTANDTTPKECDKSESNTTHITCFSNHLTYFGVLLVSADISDKDAEILFYITYIGCGISLFALVLTVLLFITNRKVTRDDSKKIHISLAVALILLNIHFLPSKAVAALSSDELCLYVALLIHYSLLASFTWMALEGFHLYLLLVKVFNIYVRRYLLKLSLVGWGLPAVIVSVVVITDKHLYGRTHLMLSKTNETEICYIIDDKVKMGTTVGLFIFVFLFNVITFGVTVKWFVSTYCSKQHGQKERNVALREILTLLSLMVLMGLPWGLIFFSLGQLPAPGLYAFCILNSLQGLFIFIYFVLYLKRSEKSSAASTPATQSASINS